MSSKLTGIITTSPIPLNPSTSMISQVLDSTKRLVNHTIIIFDGFKTSPIIKQEYKAFKSCKITRESSLKYLEFISNFHQLIDNIDQLQSVDFLSEKFASKFSNMKVSRYINHTLIVHDINIGFALAVKSAFEFIKTEYILINQHDWKIVKEIPIHGLIDILDSNPDFNYIGFVSRRSLNYTVSNHLNQTTTTLSINNLDFAKLFFWYDRTHISRLDYYKNNVFGHGYFSIGDFIEDTFGHVVLSDCKNGFWDKYGCLLFLGDGQVAVQHLNGRKTKVLD